MLKRLRARLTPGELVREIQDQISANGPVSDTKRGFCYILTLTVTQDEITTYKRAEFDPIRG